jgi:hypothetical protein
MKPPIIDRIRKEDIPQSPAWMERVLYVLNRFLESVVLLFNKNLNYKDNIDSQIYEDTINSTALTTGYKFKVTMKEIPSGVQILKLKRTTESYTSFTVAPWVNWEYLTDENTGDRTIKIHNILGIDTTSDYELTLLVI